MTIDDVDVPDDPGRRDRREHGGAGARPDDDALAERTASERVSLGVDDYAPDDVPAATEADEGPEITDTEQYADELAEVREQREAGQLRVEGDEEPFPPTSYDRS